MTLLRVGVLLLIVFSCSLLAGVLMRSALQRTSPADDASPIAAAGETSSRGALLYTIHCAKCHGDAGEGDAEGAEKLMPPPRNFASRPWRFEPTADSIERVVARGIPGTSMPAFGATLLDAEIAALTEHVLILAGGPVASSPAADEPYRAADFVRLRTPRAAPPLAIATASGEEFSLNQFQGKLVLLNFWGVSCEHCLANMAQLVEFQNQFDPESFVVVNICADEGDAAVAQEMLTAAAPQLTAYVDASGLANARYQVTALPTLWLVDRDGQLLAFARGAGRWNDPRLKALVEELLAASNAAD